MCRAGEVSVHLHVACYERATQPYLFGGGGTIYPFAGSASYSLYQKRSVFFHSLDVSLTFLNIIHVHSLFHPET